MQTARVPCVARERHVGSLDPAGHLDLPDHVAPSVPVGSHLKPFHLPIEPGARGQPEWFHLAPDESEGGQVVLQPARRIAMHDLPGPGWAAGLRCPLDRQHQGVRVRGRELFELFIQARSGRGIQQRIGPAGARCLCRPECAQGPGVLSPQCFSQPSALPAGKHRRRSVCHYVAHCLDQRGHRRHDGIENDIVEVAQCQSLPRSSIGVHAVNGRPCARPRREDISNS